MSDDKPREMSRRRRELLAEVEVAALASPAPVKLSRYSEDDLGLLLPSFRERVERLLAALRRRGFVPCFRDGYRSPEEARRNAVRGVGVADSMHCYGAAADIICGERGWDHDEFFVALGEEAKKAGLYWGGDWRKPDRPHVQGVPATRRAQDAMRRLPNDREARDALVARRMGPCEQ
jgi:hypothetical protein